MIWSGFVVLADLAEAGFFVISGLLPDFSLNWVSYFPYCEDWVISLLSCALAGRFSICSGNFSDCLSHNCDINFLLVQTITSLYFD
ncbi:hypothetical protein K1719_014229 [Acacia pycnantha]|nr:hypothetical protein K1719_014229 [Acacia pycnantha]